MMSSEPVESPTATPVAHLGESSGPDTAIDFRPEDAVVKTCCLGLCGVALAVASLAAQTTYSKADADDIQGLSVAYSEHRGRFVGFRTGYLENRVLGSLAPTPAGAFGRKHELFVGEAPSAFWIRDLAPHPGSASADGRRFLLSYWSDPPGRTAGMRFVEVTLK